MLIVLRQSDLCMTYNFDKVKIYDNKSSWMRMNFFLISSLALHSVKGFRILTFYLLLLNKIYSLKLGSLNIFVESWNFFPFLLILCNPTRIQDNGKSWLNTTELFPVGNYTSSIPFWQDENNLIRLGLSDLISSEPKVENNILPISHQKIVLQHHGSWRFIDLFCRLKQITNL